jgi:hypothetical protein
LLRCYPDFVCWDVYAGAVVTPLALAYGWRFLLFAIINQQLGK